MELVIQRSKAKEAKDFELADSLRAKIAELGFTVKDVKGGDSVVSRK
jgi:cysteinyl-tRNA synthetase